VPGKAARPPRRRPAAAEAAPALRSAARAGKPKPKLKPRSKSRSKLEPAVDLSPENSIGYLVRDCNRAFQRVLERRIGPHGVTRGQWYFLRVLWEQDGLSQRELSARVGMMEPTTVIALRGMEKAGLVRRARSAVDKRVTLVCLTAKARRLRESLIAVSQSVNDQGVAGIEPAELARFRRVIIRLTRNLDSVAG